MKRETLEIVTVANAETCETGFHILKMSLIRCSGTHSANVCVCVYLRQFIVGDVSCVQLDLHFDLVTVHIQSVFALATNEVSPYELQKRNTKSSTSNADSIRVSFLPKSLFVTFRHYERVHVDVGCLTVTYASRDCLTL